MPAVCLLPAAPSQPWLVPHCRNSEVLSPRVAPAPSGEPHQPPASKATGHLSPAVGDLPRVLRAAVASGGFTALGGLLAGEGARTGS